MNQKRAGVYKSYVLRSQKRAAIQTVLHAAITRTVSTSAELRPIAKACYVLDAGREGGVGQGGTLKDR